MKSKLVLLFLIVTVYFIFTQNSDIVAKYLEEAGNNYRNKNYEKAYNYINFVIRSGGAEDYLEAKVLAAEIYYEYINKLFIERNYEQINNISRNISNYHYLNTEKLSLLFIKIKKTIEEELIIKIDNTTLTQGNGSSLGASNTNILEKKLDKELVEKVDKLLTINKSTETKDVLVKKINELLLVNKDKNSEIESYLLEMSKNDKELMAKLKKIELETSKNFNYNNRYRLFVIIAIMVVILTLGLIILFIVLLIKHTIHQKKLLQLSLSMPTQINILNMPSLNFPNASRSLSADKKYFLIYESDMNRKNKIKNLLETCHDIGKQIDEKTGRKNNSKNAAELIYKISKDMGYNESESLLFCAVGFIYDIGFLSIDESVLKAKENDIDKNEIIKKHVTLGIDKISFIDKEFRQIFYDAILHHHRFIDGTGYPENMNAIELPFIAKMVAVVDSYLGLISLRHYKNSVDRNSALNELEQNGNKYDKEILKALHEVL